jgi:hypothetical protein
VAKFVWSLCGGFATVGCVELMIATCMRRRRIMFTMVVNECVCVCVCVRERAGRMFQSSHSSSYHVSSRGAAVHWLM